MQETKNTNAGFTLIELLVVIAIIAVLVSIIIPVLGEAEKVGENTTCMSNMQQLGIGVMAYQVDTGKYPIAYSGSSGVAWVDGMWEPFWVAWSYEEHVRNGTLWPFVNTMKVYKCPTFDRKFRDANPNFAHLDAYCTYSLNEYISGRWQGQDRAERTLIRHPARFGILAEEFVLKTTDYVRHTINNLAFGPGSFDNPASNSGSIVDGMGEFHSAPDDGYLGGKTHVAFADGHVELREAKDTKEIFTPWYVKNSKFPALYPN